MSLTSLSPKTAESTISALLDIMARLRDPETGCAWDKQQTFASIAPYTIEEAYEVSDAIDRNDIQALCDELGDLLLQVVFHSRIAQDQGHFNFADVASGISEKMIRRHPHIFGNAEHSPGWEAIKADERNIKADGVKQGALAGVAMALPALLRAEKLQKRAARTGFDWPDLVGVTAKIEEEMAEVAATETAEEREEEIGDLLFAVVNLARHLRVNPETALRKANAKFERRFASMENFAAEAAQDFSALNLDAKEAFWAQAKAAEKGSVPR
jgi:nucleoside triphosphate diphosphatase